MRKTTKAQKIDLGMYILLVVGTAVLWLTGYDKWWVLLLGYLILLIVILIANIIMKLLVMYKFWKLTHGHKRDEFE